MTSRFKLILLLIAASIHGLFGADPAAVAPGKVEKTIVTGELFTFNPLKNIAVYKGDVLVIDPGMDLLCDKLTIYFGDKKKSPPKPKTPTVPADVKKPAVAPMVGLGGNIDKIIAEGGVEIINKKDKTRAVGGNAVYSSKTEVLVLTVNPKLYTKQGVLVAEVIEYNRLTGELSAKHAILENENKPKAPNNKPPGK